MTLFHSVTSAMNGDETSWTPFFEMYTKGLDEGWLLDPSVFAEIAIGSVEQAPMVYSQTPENPVLV